VSIYDRIAGTQQPRISVHALMSCMQEYMLGNMSGAQATAALGLDAAEQAEALALRDRLLQEPSTTNGIQRRMKALEIENVLILLEAGIAPFDNVAAVKLRIGV
jgi:hypothetical protein